MRLILSLGVFSIYEFVRYFAIIGQLFGMSTFYSMPNSDCAKIRETFLIRITNVMSLVSLKWYCVY